MRGYWMAMAAVVACGGGDEPSAKPSPATGGAGGAGGSGGMVEASSSVGGTGGTGAAGGAACIDSLPADAPIAEKLSDTGLFDDVTTRTLHPGVERYVPRWVLWSDGATKDRYIYVPECGSIDTTDPDDWRFPVGTRFWKSFAKDGVLIETRLVRFLGPDDDDWFMSSYLWDADGTDATRVPAGQPDAKGTSHDVPDEQACRQCHGGGEPFGGGRRSRGLGFSALQLAGTGDGIRLDQLDDRGWVDAPLSEPTVPGSADEQAALGMLHVNCGPCHNAGPEGVASLDLNLWLDGNLPSVEQSAAYLTAVGVANQGFAAPGITGRIVPGDPAASSIWFRMTRRGDAAQMPPVGSEEVDEAGVAALESWIGSLP